MKLEEKKYESSIIEIDSNAEEILKLRYYATKYGGEKEESFKELCQRVSRVIASAETLYTNDIDKIRQLEKSIYNDMLCGKFLFNSPALFSSGAGQVLDEKYSKLLYKSTINFEDYKYLQEHKSKNQMLFACFVIGVPDSLEGIFDSVKNAAIISKFGGGVGANFSNLREKTADISGGTGGKASGPISFMETWNTMGSVVVQGGKRRAALMGMLNSSHPDVEDFINCKTEDGKLQYFNVSVAIDNAFMNAVFNDENYYLISPITNTIVKTVKAKELWDKICNSAHKRGDPGIFFVDLANNDSLLQGMSDYKIESTNPCLAGNTKILMSDGTTKKIKDIVVGDMIETCDTTTLLNSSEKVV
ncbi:MAG TPA: ribonucleotide reductase N-terminal alpha domain-containing protein, partial [Bacteroidales bacterium]|nr:ribonucleotide reductase N-terminal alpha domain-containing protein [Bacteroidales bacterium]